MAHRPSVRTLRLARAALQAAYFVSEDLGTSLAERLFTTPRHHDRPTRERQFLATARSFELPVTLRSPRGTERLRLAAWRWGGTHRPTVLLVHGWEGRGSQLGSFVEPLVAAGMSVVAFDAPAHGDSPGSRLYLSDQADAIADAVAYVGPVHAIIAHSFGVSGLLVAHARHGVDALRNVAIAPNVVVDDVLDNFARTIALLPDDRRALEDALGAHTGIAREDLDLARLAGGRDAGLLVVHDTDDREIPLRHGEHLAAAWPQAQLRVTTGLGHRRILRDADVIAATVDFVRQGVRGPASDLVREVDRALDATA